jgi:two-component system chemotaxis response regulator CheB
MAELEPGAMLSEQRVGTPSTFSCPECHGVMCEIQDESLLRYRCRVGHALTAHGMMAEQSEALETAMWVALKTLEENISLSRRLGQHASALKQDWLIKHYADRVQEGEANAIVIRESLMKSMKYMNKPSIGQASALEVESGI